MQEPDESFPSNSQHALQREEPLSEHGMEASRIPLETPRNVITDKYTDLGSQMRAKAKDHSESQQESAQPVNHRMAEAELRAHLCAAEREYNKCQRLASAKRQGTIGTEHTTPEVAHPNETERKDSSHERYNDFTVERAYDDRISRTSEQGSPLSENELSDIISQGVR